tara:strand:- start:62 stop:394 length:333 start_codon:yes stop_codon:yes gene_type:complete
MAVTWNITNTEYNNDSDKGVIHAAWSATDSEVVGSGDSAVTHTGKVEGRESYTPNPSAAGYKAYDSLTEANVRAWVKATLGSEEVTRVENKVAAQITKSKTPPTASGVPW